ncbi:MAG: fumarylacetoacetate hydrolase family protein [Planctomycetales bacterium]|nr:fumarylacetoacetate hydrolase family protein [Planctomycetales bacterium]
MLLYRTSRGPVVGFEGRYYAVEESWTDLVNDDNLAQNLARRVEALAPDDTLSADVAQPLPPLGDQEIWAAGVTYFRSRTARMEESQEAGGGDFYDRVYHASRPELFFKATPSRTVGPGQAMHLRKDSRWIVPEPELTLAVTRSGTIVGYTVGNDLSCRDLEGENPLYLPQAKTFARCAAVGPAILVANAPLSPDVAIRLVIRRDGEIVCDEATSLANLKRSLEELVSYLFRENEFANGCLLMTGTGVVPPDNFSLQPGDVVDITIDGIGTLSNSME